MNPSLSFTLGSLFTEIEVTLKPQEELEWTYRFDPDGLTPHELSRVYSHLAKCEKALPQILDQHRVPYRRGFYAEMLSRNSFPAACGIASSASSFSAITFAAFLSFAQDWRTAQAAFMSNRDLAKKLSALSRQGSGSSCRSFFGPWTSWDNEFAEPISTSLPEFRAWVLIASDAKKKTPSSVAHERVKSSPLWEKREERATARFNQMKVALAKADLALLSKLTLQEAWEMHSLFHTADSPFTYFVPETLKILAYATHLIDQGLNPLVTLDAGPNVHLLLPKSHTKLPDLDKFLPGIRILESNAGQGPYAKETGL